MSNHLLSKTSIIKGLQCEKALYLYKHYYQLRDKLSAEKKAIFKRGNDVGVYAQSLFPNGVDATPKGRRSNAKWVENTQQLLQNGTEVIYEAAFLFEQVFIAIDILVKTPKGYIGYEVKSSARISKTYMLDAAIQYYVITSSGISLQKIFITHLNTGYKRDGNLEASQLFNSVDVTVDSKKEQKEIAKITERLKNVVNGMEIPTVNVGGHCFKPYACDFMNNCWKGGQSAEIFGLIESSKVEQANYYKEGIHNYEQLKGHKELSKNQQLQIAAKPIADTKKIGAFLDGIKYPITFLDIEQFQPAIPQIDQTSPFQQIPFLYSLHFLQKDGELTEKVFFAKPAHGVDIRDEFANNLLLDFPAEGSIVVYDKNTENKVLAALKAVVPKRQQELIALQKRVVDLMDVFKSKLLYLPAMNGSHSLKNVYPALYPNEGYDDLMINSGFMASVAYTNLFSEPDMFKRIEIEENLTNYCKLDTLALVKIYQYLIKKVGS